MSSNYCDLTSFEQADDPWNGWSKESNGDALVIAEASGNHFAQFANFSGHLLGPIIKKSFIALTPGDEYCISIRVKRLGQSKKTPTLTWSIDGTQQGQPFAVEDTDWHVFRTRFTASASTHQIILRGRDSYDPGNGGDFCFDDIRLYPTVLEEDFSGHPQQIIKPGEQLDGRCMVISIPSDSVGRAGIRVHTGAVPNMQEGESLTLSYEVTNQNPPQRVNILLKGEYSKLHFSWTWIHRAGSVEFFDHNKNSLGAIEVLPSDGLHRRLSFEVENPDDYVVEILVTCRDYSQLDFFSFAAN